MIRQIIITEPVKNKIKDKQNLPAQIRNNFHWFYWCIDMLLKNESSPLLRRRKIEGAKDCWEFTITGSYKAIYRKEGITAVILAIDNTTNIADAID